LMTIASGLGPVLVTPGNVDVDPDLAATGTAALDMSGDCVRSWTIGGQLGATQLHGWKPGTGNSSAGLSIAQVMIGVAGGD
jgi:hypothetical protein